MNKPVFIEYIPRRFKPETLVTIRRANDIIEEFAAQGYDLTLRQLYYQFVAKDLLPNNQKSYNNLGATISDARLAGLVAWNRIADRTRNVKGGGGWETPGHIIDAVAQQYHRDLWADQPYYVEVWVEKEALANVVERACQSLNLPWFCCRGYVSQSEMHAASERFQRMADDGNGKDAVIVHLGDHDPSGIDMSRDIEDRMNMFAWGEADWRENGDPMIQVRRIALNMDQIQLYNPPPNPAKQTDCRFKAYELQYGEKSWELDALAPRVLQAMIEDEVKPLLDEEKWAAAQARQAREKALLGTVSRRWDDVVAQLERRP